MKLGEKGFAISTILYGLLLMGSLMLFLLLGTISFEHDSSTDFGKEIAKDLNNCVQNGNC